MGNESLPPSARVTLPLVLRPVDAGEFVRLGQARNGGYVLPKACIGVTDTLLSFGLSANWEFERAFLRAWEAFGKPLKIHAYDRTVSARKLDVYRVKSLAHLLATADARFWRAFRMAGGYREFFDGRTATNFEEMVSWRDGPKESSIAHIMGRIDPTRKVFLSMDIEGHEYRICEDLLDFADRFTGVAIEFHDLDILRDRFEHIHAGLSRSFAVAHIHVNNVRGLGRDGLPVILEMTYVHRVILGPRPRPSGLSYPVAGLDMANSADRPDFEIEFE